MKTHRWNRTVIIRGKEKKTATAALIRPGYPTALMIVTYATVFLLIIDLDRPARGLFKVSQEPMIELREDIYTALERQFTNEGAARPPHGEQDHSRE
jgi:hypothetical protein